MVAAVCGIKMTSWDLLGKSVGSPSSPICSSGRRRTSLGRPPSSWRAGKLKIGLDPEEDVEIVRRVREAVGSGIRVRADVNGPWMPGTARRQLHRLAAYDLEYVKQPLLTTTSSATRSSAAGRPFRSRSTMTVARTATCVDTERPFRRTGNGGEVGSTERRAVGCRIAWGEAFRHHCHEVEGKASRPEPY
jgi:L-alanine-DL-glutamate epimerase-like enolase superfamily enzyme